jgi:hypothetical protein
MTMYQIETDVPVPTRWQSGTLQGTLRQMEVGQSVWVPKNSNVTSGAGRTVAQRIGDGRKYAVRQEKKDGVNGARIWRVA